MVAFIAAHWLLILILAGLAIGVSYLVYCALLVGSAMYDEFFGAGPA